MSSEDLELYISKIKEIRLLGNATENTYRPALKSLLESAKSGITATNEPAQISRMAPDFVVQKGIIPIGYVETKDIGDNLNKTLNSRQLKRYKAAFPNLILTDYLEFIWLQKGTEQFRVKLGEASGKQIQLLAGAEADWKKLKLAFFGEIALSFNTPKQLATTLAAQTKLLRDMTLDFLTKDVDKELRNQQETFAKVLVPGLTDKNFADMFAQTLTYGLFTARVFDKTKEDFSLAEAFTLIPKANPFLRKFFQYIAQNDSMPNLKWMIEQIVQILLHSDMDKILYRQTRKLGFKDPVFYFYETFLAEYDPKLRKSCGVYYTPEPVVDYIVRAVDHLLRTRFNRIRGLSDPDTLILDPAVGTATFLRRVVDEIYKQQCDEGMQGAWTQYVSQNLLTRLFGFEFMMAPYTVAHLKLELQLIERGADLTGEERLQIYLTNTLDRIEAKSDVMFGQWLAEESKGAERVKEIEPVQVVLGNPPYLGESKNKSFWILDLIDEYKKEPDGSKLEEKNSKWINDDYVKFIRFAHWRVTRTGHGMVAYIANHSWLGNPTFRGMRASLMRDFDEIYVLDLHGDTQKKEHTPDSHIKKWGKDKNVFDIVKGVAILFLVRLQSSGTKKKNRMAKVYRADLWGTRKNKYDWLQATDFDKTVWQELTPLLPNLLFTIVDTKLLEEYQRGFKVTDIFPINGSGIITKCDALNIHWDADSTWTNINWFEKASEEEARQRLRLPKPNVRDWKFDWAKKDIAASGLKQKFITPILYRPFDTRWTFYTGKSRGIMGWPVVKIMRHILNSNNIALIVPRQVKDDWGVFACNTIGGHKTCSAYDINYYFPLWLEPLDNSGIDEHPDMLVETTRSPNLSPHFLKSFTESLKLKAGPLHGLPKGITPENIFHYVYAVLHAPEYRNRYTDFLKSDFPRIPLASNKKTFNSLVGLGAQLVDLHLLRKTAFTKERMKLAPTYPKTGDNTVEKVIYVPPKDSDKGRVHINPQQYFDGITPELYAHRIGGYQVLEKWLKDRKGRALTIEDIKHYRKIAVVLTETQHLMQKINAQFLNLLPTT